MPEKYSEILNETSIIELQLLDRPSNFNQAMTISPNTTG
jgi:hypothetical protein